AVLVRDGQATGETNPGRVHSTPPPNLGILWTAPTVTTAVRGVPAPPWPRHGGPNRPGHPPAPKAPGLRVLGVGGALPGTTSGGSGGVRRRPRAGRGLRSWSASVGIRRHGGPSEPP